MKMRLWFQFGTSDQMAQSIHGRIKKRQLERAFSLEETCVFFDRVSHLGSALEPMTSLRMNDYRAMRY
jgi:hypothetical protein